MNDLDQLKELLFGAEKEALDSIAERVERREIRAADVADILPEAIHQRHQEDNELVESLTQPVGECLQAAFRDDPQTYSDALYPVMGPAIRKSIMHALRNFGQQINEAVEHSVSPKGLKWRWQASRAGVPFGEYLLQKTMRYRVEQAYLISRENGLLMGHAHHEASKIKDSDAVSAMFTAIQDFVKESFSPDRTGRLESADMGEFTLWAVHGPHALLVCVIRGVPPKGLRADLSAILERIHFRYGEAIREYRGDTSTVPDVEAELDRCLRFEARAETASKRGGMSRSMLLVAILLLGVVAYLGFRSYQLTSQMRELDAALAATPGVHLTDISRNGDHYTVRGLSDPLAPAVPDIADGIGIDPGRVSATMQPFQSLDPAIITQRARQIFGEPDGVRLSVVGDTLRVVGEASSSWQRELESGVGNLAGVANLDLSELRSGDVQDLVDQLNTLNGRRFYFAEGAEMIAADRAALREYARNLRDAKRRADEAGIGVRVLLTGSADAIGSAVSNAALATRRAVFVLQELSDNGVIAEVDPRSVEIHEEAEPVEDIALRFVRVDLQLDTASVGR
jgi:OOP family OmpA-OmpF porin